MIEALIYLLAITAAEVVKSLLATQWGILCHIAILMAIIVRSSLVNEHSYQQLILPLALVTLMGIISPAVAQVNIPQIWLYPTIYVLLLAPAAAVVIILRYEAINIGLSLEWFGLQLLVGGTGLLLALVGNLILKPDPIIAYFAWTDIWPPALIFLLCTGFIEEFIFRGVIQYGAVKAFGELGIVYVSLLSAVLYIGISPGLWIIFPFVISLYFGRIVKETKSILGAALAHGICNIALYLIFPFFF